MRAGIEGEVREEEGGGCYCSSAMEVMGRSQGCRLAIFHHSVSLSSSLLPLQSVLSVCRYLPPPFPLLPHTFACQLQQLWEEMESKSVISLLDLHPLPNAPVPRLTPADSSFRIIHAAGRCDRVRSPLAWPARRSKGTAEPGD